LPINETIRVSHVLDNGELVCWCPFHSDSNPSLYVNPSKGVAHCFAGCYSGDIVGLVAMLRETNRLMARSELYEAFDFDNLTDLSRLPAQDVTTEKHIDAIKWFTDQGFTLRTAYYWKVEFNDTSFTLPIRNVNSKILAYITRNLVSFPKYVMSKGFKKNVLFGLLVKVFLIVCGCGRTDSIMFHC